MQSPDSFFKIAKAQNPEIWASALADVTRNPHILHELAEETAVSLSLLTICDFDHEKTNMWGENCAHEVLVENLERRVFDALVAHLQKVRPCGYCADYQTHHCPECSGKFWV